VAPDFKAESLLTDDGLTAPILDLSFGTREQLAFLSRLCLAEMLSEKERNLVVFDDNLVHTDPPNRYPNGLTLLTMRGDRPGWSTFRPDLCPDLDRNFHPPTKCPHSCVGTVTGPLCQDSG
jgi:hypothetical protein